MLIGAGLGGGSVTQDSTASSFEVRHGELVIGDTGPGSYTISSVTLRTLNPAVGGGGGDPDTQGDITVGQWDDGSGTLSVTGDALVEAAVNLKLADGRADGPASRGTVTQTGGSVRVGTAGAGDLVMATHAPGLARYELAAGTLDLTGGDIVRGACTSTFAMTGGLLQNVGSIDGPFDPTGGLLAVGDGSGIGTTTVIDGGGFTLGAEAQLGIESTLVGGAAVHDKLVVTGAARAATSRSPARCS